MAKKRLTANQKAYAREIQRLARGFKILSKKGYEQIHNLPQQPKRITKKFLKELKSITSRNFFGTVDTETGELKTLKDYTPKQKRFFEVPKPKKHKQYEPEEHGTDNIDSTPEYIPTFSLYEAIRARIVERIDEMGDIKNAISGDYRFYLLTHCLEVLDNNYISNPTAYGGYLSEHEDEIAENIDIIARDSNSSRVENSYTELLQLLCVNEDYIQIQKGINATEDDIDNPFLYE